MSFFNKYYFAGVGTGCGLSVLILFGFVGISYWVTQKMMTNPEATRVAAVLPVPDFPGEGEGISVYGTADPEWGVQTLEGEDLLLGDFHGQVVFLNLWATWCGPCKVEMPAIDSLYRALEGEDVVFLIASNETADKVRDFMETKDYAFPVHLRSGTRPVELQSRGIPTTFIIDREGYIVHKHTGSARWHHEDVVTFIRSLLNDGSAEDAETPTGAIPQPG